MKFFCFVIVCVFLFSCNENMPLNQADATKYIWLKPFIPGNAENFTGTHNIDNGTLKFSFSYKNIDGNILGYMDSIAKVENWNIIQESVNREYAKYISHYPTDTLKTVMKINLDAGKEIIYFEITDR